MPRMHHRSLSHQSNADLIQVEVRKDEVSFRKKTVTSAAHSGNKDITTRVRSDDLSL